jgi:hypothetical protein
MGNYFGRLQYETIEFANGSALDLALP